MAESEHLQLLRYITTQSEDSNSDAKAPIAWDGGVESAKLAKDIAAFANSRDGGAIVIGKMEVAPGAFDLVGVSEDQARSFETTRVANWVNSKFSPAVTLRCERIEHDDKIFVVIVVDEFQDIPTICESDYSESTCKKQLLKRGAVYVRTANAESAPLYSADQLRLLIGRATAKQRNEILAMLDSALQGRALIDQPSDTQRFDAELTAIEKSLAPQYQLMIESGAWRFIVRPTRFREERYDSIEALANLIQKHSVRLVDSYPPSFRGNQPDAWGVWNDLYGEPWALARSGQFLSIHPYYENENEYRARGASSHPEPVRASRTWMDFKPNLMLIAERFMFAARLATEFEQDDVELKLEATALRGRALMSTDSRIDLRHVREVEECRAERFSFKKQIRAEELQLRWEELAAKVMKEFCDYFPGPPCSLDTMRQWVEKFKSRQV